MSENLIKFKFGAEVGERTVGLEVLKLIFYLLIFGFVIWAAYYTSKKIATSSTSFGNSKYMQVIDRMMFGKEVAVVIVKIGEKYFLVSQSSAGVELIREFTDEEFEEIQNSEVNINRAENPLGDIFANIASGIGFGKGKNKTEDSEKEFNFSGFKARRKKDEGEILGRYDGDLSDVENMDFDEILKRGLGDSESKKSGTRSKKTYGSSKKNNSGNKREE